MNRNTIAIIEKVYEVSIFFIITILLNEIKRYVDHSELIMSQMTLQVSLLFRLRRDFC